MSKFVIDDHDFEPNITDTALSTESRDISDSDPVSFEIINHRLWSITEEQSGKIRQVSASPAVSEVNDFNITITTELGEVVSISPFILTHSGGLDLAIKWILEHRDGNPGIEPGDMFLCNDPWIGAIHQNDVMVAAPIFHEGELFSWTVTTLHQIDVGGSEPGGFSMSAESVYEEAEPTPPIKIVEGGEIRADVEDMFRRRSRQPEAFSLDLRAQIATNNTVTARVHELIDEYDAATVKGVMHGLIDRAEAKFRDRIAEIPDGTWWNTTYQESASQGDLGVYGATLEIKKRDDTLRVSVSGDPQVGVINCTYAGLCGGIINAVLPLLCHDIPWSLGGIYNALDIEAEPGTLVNADHPSSVGGATITGAWMVRNLANATIAEMLDSTDATRERLLAGCAGAFPTVTLQGEFEGEVFTDLLTDPMAGGWGARSFGDGIDTGGILSTPKGRVTNVETTEQILPILYLFRREAIDSGGAGQYRGGMGGESAIVPHKTEQPISQKLTTFGELLPTALGIAGGYPGGTVNAKLYSDTAVTEQFAGGSIPDVSELGEDVTVIPPKSMFETDVSDVFYIRWPGGGGYGDPLTRSPEAVREDVLSGAVSIEAAKSVYGVVLTDDRAVDEQATEQHRETLRGVRAASGGEQG